MKPILENNFTHHEKIYNSVRYSSETFKEQEIKRYATNLAKSNVEKRLSKLK